MLHDAVFAGHIDLTEVILSTFVLFFVGLVIYLRREDRREGYPLEQDVSGRLEPSGGLFFTAKPKTYILPHGHGTLTTPNSKRESQELNAQRTSRAPGSPLEPVGDPLLAGVGPGSYAQRARQPDLTLHGKPKIVPLRLSEGFFLDPGGPDPRGYKVVGADGAVGGVVSDLWVDRAEYLIRYLEVAVSPTKTVLLPMTMAVVKNAQKQVRVDAVLGGQIAGAPVLASEGQVTMDEEERVCAYYGGGFLYASTSRVEPIL
jgi:photosynthetic reaction center H subunit